MILAVVGWLVYKYLTMVSGKTPIRYLRVERTDNQRDFINITGLELWSGSTRRRAVTGMVSPFLTAETDWNKLDDGDINTLAHTHASEKAFMELDFGAAGQTGDTVKVFNRENGSEDGKEVLSQRLVGCTLTVKDTAGKVVLSRPLGNELIYTFKLPP